MNLDEYRVGGRARYAAFVAAIQTILAAAVERLGMTPHAITGRAKELKSLAKKLADRGIDPASAIDEQLKDLAGCRIVFLTNSQVTRFSSSGALHDNFEVISVNDHHPVPGTVTEGRLFDSTNYLVQLRPDRLALPEYAAYTGMRAEIQIQTLLNHAWAEMGHDTIYKEPDLRHVDPSHLEQIETRMTEVMRNHLLPAGHEFDKIARDFAKVLRADQSVDEVSEILESSNSNDALAEALGTLDELILPFIADRSTAFLKLVPTFVAVVERSRNSEPGQIETIFGDYAGKTGTAVARGVAAIVKNRQFIDRPLTFHTILNLFLGASEDAERKIWIDAATGFAEYRLDAWRQVGPLIQAEIVEAIEGLGGQQLSEARGLLIPMLGKIVSTRLEGMERGTFNTVQILTGSVSADDALRDLRSRAIALLERFLDEAGNDDHRREVLAAMRNAATPPFHGGNEALRTVVMNDAARLAEAQRSRAPGWSLELRRHVETQAFQTYRNFHKLPADMTGNAALVAAQGGVVEALFALRDSLNADDDFVLYKTLMGRDSVGADAWSEAMLNPRLATAWRLARYPEIVATIDASNIEAWIERMRRYLTEGSKHADAWPMANFIGTLAEAKPDIAVSILAVIDDLFEPVLIPLLLGLDRAGHSDALQPFVDDWIAQGRHLLQLVEWVSNRTAADARLLARIAARARDVPDNAAVFAALDAVTTLYERAADPALIDDVLMPLLDYLTAAELPEWIDTNNSVSSGALILALDKDQARALIWSFVAVPRIDYLADKTLAFVTDHFPSLVLEFFEQRVSRARAMGPSRFEAVARDIHDLRAALDKDPAMLVAATRRWHDSDPVLHQYLGGRLLGNVFPELTEELAAPLREIIKQDGPDGLTFVLTTLIAYEGHEAIFPLCMDVVDRLDDGDAMLGRVSQVLRERGVMSGEFGVVTAERRQHGLLQPWLVDPRPKVQSFVKVELHRIEQAMAAEQRRAQHELEQMKLDWGGPAAPAGKADAPPAQ